MKQRIYLACLLAAGLAYSCSKEKNNEELIDNPDSTNPIRITASGFSPNSIELSLNAKVAWYNDDQAPHSVMADAQSFSSSGEIVPGGSFTYMFKNAGTFTYSCGIHPSEKGTVIIKMRER